jgi:hypothetical protein
LWRWFGYLHGNYLLINFIEQLKEISKFQENNDKISGRLHDHQNMRDLVIMHANEFGFAWLWLLDGMLQQLK